MNTKHPTTASSGSKFALGHLVMTSNANSILDPRTVQTSIARHARGDWGDLCDEDREENERALVRGSRLLSVYYDGTTKFYIITESDRSSTCVLLPEDY